MTGRGCARLRALRRLRVPRARLLASRRAAADTRRIRSARSRSCSRRRVAAPCGIAAPAFGAALALETLVGAALGTAISHALRRRVSPAAGCSTTTSAFVRSVPSANVQAGAGSDVSGRSRSRPPFFTLGGDRVALEALAQTFQSLPPGESSRPRTSPRFAVALPATLSRAALFVAGPALALAFAAQIALATVARVVPRFSTFALAFPVVFACALLATIGSLPVVLPAAAHALVRSGAVRARAAERVAEEKPFDPTASRLARAKREGDVPRSHDLVAVASFAGSAAAAWIALPFATASVRAALLDAARGLRPQAARLRRARDVRARRRRRGARRRTRGHVPADARTFAFKAPVPAFGKLDPVRGLKRMASRESALAALKAIAVSSAVAAAHRAGTARCRGVRRHGERCGLALRAGRVAVAVVASALAVAAAFALADVALERAKWLRRLRMSLRRSQARPQAERRRSAAQGPATASAPVARARVARAPRGAPPSSSRIRRTSRSRSNTVRPRSRYRACSCARPTTAPRASNARARELGIPIVENVALARALLAATRRGRRDSGRNVRRRRRDRRIAARGTRDRMNSHAQSRTVLRRSSCRSSACCSCRCRRPCSTRCSRSTSWVRGSCCCSAVAVGDPLEFAAFAPALLIATLFRLSLDVSATRLILTQGHHGGRRRRDHSRPSAHSSCAAISSSA